MTAAAGEGGRPRYAWYGDDFTGATDTLATLAEAGLRALLFLALPDAARLAAVGPLDAIGIAGATRAMAPAAAARELDAAGRFLAEQGVALMHYKCCSTLDSAPDVGSIGAAAAALRPHFANPFLPIVGGQPNLGRYCLFGTLFAAAGSGGPVHRIDRHPTMSMHPVTPMQEADLRRHLAAQGLAPIGLLDYRAYAVGDAAAALDACLADRPAAVLLDVAEPADLAVIGRLIAARLPDGPMLAIGASSVAQAFATIAPPGPASGGAMPPPRRPGPALALVGSLSPVTRAQVAQATGWTRLDLDAARLTGDPAWLEAMAAEARARLGEGDVMLVTRPPGGAPVAAGLVADATARLLRAVMSGPVLRRLVIAGGDTSSLAVRALDLWGLSYRAPMVPGAPLCRAHAEPARLDGLDLVLKGGQMGPPNFFELARTA